MEKIKEVSYQNTEEAQALENGLKTLVSMVVRIVMSEISIQSKITHKVNIEPAKLSPKSNLEQPEESLLLNVSDVARLLRVSRVKAYQLVHSHQIPSVRFGRRILIPRTILSRFIEDTAYNSMRWAPFLGQERDDIKSGSC